MVQKGIRNWYLSSARPVKLSTTHTSSATYTYRMLDAGKSTLIKMLIQLHEQSKNPNDLSFPSPMVGVPPLDRHNANSGNTHIPMEYIPTSADVHLYADPVRFDKRTPLLYADCEGLDGGGNLPVGAPENRTTLLNIESTIARLTPGRLRRLAWADAEQKKRTRGFSMLSRMWLCLLYQMRILSTRVH
jgi:hypothetical protein